MKNPSAQNIKADAPDETRSIFKLLLVGGVALALPLFLYALSRLTGSLPSFQEWTTLGSNHGPWRGELRGYTLFLPFLAAFATIAVGFRHMLRNHFTRAIRCLGLAVVQGAAAFVLLALIGWTID